MKNQHSGLDRAINNSSLLTCGFRSTEGKGVIWLAIDLLPELRTASVRLQCSISNTKWFKTDQMYGFDNSLWLSMLNYHV